MFCQGQKVVCIDDKFLPHIAQLYTELPVEGRTYVIRGVTVGVTHTETRERIEGEICVYLVGISNPKSNSPPFRERGFNAMRFRSLDEMQGREPEEADAGEEWKREEVAA